MWNQMQQNTMYGTSVLVIGNTLIDVSEQLGVEDIFLLSVQPQHTGHSDKWPKKVDGVQDGQMKSKRVKLF
jgi:hypothetical protein